MFQKLATGLAMSGLAFVGMVGVAELITHSGGFLKPRSVDNGVPGSGVLASRCRS
jgi:hypothetical protein